MMDVKYLRKTLASFDAGIEALCKQAFVPAPAPAGPATGAPPMDPAMDPAMAGGGAPMPPPGPGGMPVDPNTGMPIDPATGMPIDPNTGAPMDPAAMQGGGAPMPPPGPGAGAPPAGGMPPELEGMLSEMANGVTSLSEMFQNQQATIDQLATRLQELEGKSNELHEMLNGPAGFEGSTKTPDTAGPQDSAMSTPPLPPLGA